MFSIEATPKCRDIAVGVCWWDNFAMCLMLAHPPTQHTCILFLTYIANQSSIIKQRVVPNPEPKKGPEPPDKSWGDHCSGAIDVASRMHWWRSACSADSFFMQPALQTCAACSADLFLWSLPCRLLCEACSAGFYPMKPALQTGVIKPALQTCVCSLLRRHFLVERALHTWYIKPALQALTYEVCTADLFG